MNQKYALSLIIISLILIIINTIITPEFDLMYWVLTTSSALVILAMLMAIKNKKGSS